MERRIAERVEDWDSRPFSDGHDGLRELSESEFTGAVHAGGTWLFLLNGRIVGVFDGTIESVEDADGTAYGAPHQSLPLLYTMQAKAGEPRAKYYTNDTPISEVHETLSSGTFTGYVELSENVLSGDYYQVYHGGRSMSVAFVGASEQMITGDEAFQRADDEVGIYEVYEVDIEVTELPSEADGEDQPRSGVGPGEESVSSGEQSHSSSGRRDRPEPEQGVPERHADDAEPAPDARDRPTGTSDRRQRSSERTGESSREERITEPSGTDDAETESSRGDETGSVDRSRQHRTGRTEEPDGSDRGRDTSEVSSERTRSRRRSDRDTRGSDPTNRGDRPSEGADRRNDESTVSDRSIDRPTRSPPEPAVDRDEDAEEPVASGSRPATEDSVDGISAPDPEDAVSAPDPEDAVSAPDPEDGAAVSGNDNESAIVEEEADWQDADTIPSLDPDRTGLPDEKASPDQQTGSEVVNSPETEDTTATGRAQQEGGDDPEGPDMGESTDVGSGARNVDGAFDAEVLEREDRIDRLQQRVSNLEAERNDLRVERDELARTVDRLREEKEDLLADIDHLESEIAELEAEVDRLESTESVDDQVPTNKRSLSASEALGGTDLFVRYASKSDATLDDAHDGDATPAEVNDNLRLEQHTRFESNEVTVDGQPFEEFLTDTLEYRFVEWFVTQLPYEIRETGHVDGLKDLFDGFPDVDRAELDAEISLRYEEDGEEIREQQRFDVVIRDRMGNPLVVANLNDSRDPAGQDMMVDLKAAADRVKETSDTLGGAFLVTRSFFAPGALEAASEATSDGFLSRSSRKSYVKLSRKRGYHLCLVEARGDDFHLNVPEL